MSKEYRILSVAPLQRGATFVEPRQHVAEWVTMDHPALSVMTDFAVVTAHTVSPLETIEIARFKMIHHGVRSLLVTDDQNHILGFITATDLTGERPMQVIRTQGIRHADVLVKDIMTPRERLEVMRIEDLETALVGDVVATLKGQGRQHALVVERTPDHSQTLRGMFSTSQVARQVGVAIPTVDVSAANSFAEIGASLND